MAAKKSPTGWAGSRNNAWANGARRALAKPASSATPAPAAATSAPTSAAPGAAPAAPARVDPFNTTGQVQDKIGWDFSNANSIEDLKGIVAQAGTQATYDSTQNERSAVVNQSRNSDNMAARGIVQSSVRDAASYDIEAQRALQKGLIDDTLHNVTTSANAKLEAIRVANQAYQTNYNAQAVENARAAEATIVPADPGPAAPPKPNTAQLIQQWKDRPYTVVDGTDSKGHAGQWHHYKDGRSVFVPR
jgi:hypothetical protein